MASNGHLSAEAGGCRGDGKIDSSDRLFGRAVESSGTDVAQASPHRQASNSAPACRECTSLHRQGRLPLEPPAQGTSRPTRRSTTSSQNGAGTESWLGFMIDCGRSRVRKNPRSRPTGAIIDGQTVRSAGLAAEAGYDAANRTKGRKRFIMIDQSERKRNNCSMNPSVTMAGCANSG